MRMDRLTIQRSALWGLVPFSILLHAASAEATSGGVVSQPAWSTTVIPAAEPAHTGAPGRNRGQRGAVAPAKPQPVATSPAVDLPASPQPDAAPASAPAARAESEHPAYSVAVQQYCSNIAPVAAEARAAWLRKIITEHERELELRIKELEAKTAEHKEWLTKREEFAKKVGNGLVQLVSRMKPEAAAQQIALMDEETAAALIVKLDAKTAGLLLSEVPAQKAARLSTTIATVASLGARRGSGAPDPGQAGGPAEPVR